MIPNSLTHVAGGHSRFDISDTVRELGLRLDSAADFDLEIKLRATNGSFLDSSLIRKPSIFFQPGEGGYIDSLPFNQSPAAKEHRTGHRCRTLCLSVPR